MRRILGSIIVFALIMYVISCCSTGGFTEDEIVFVNGHGYYNPDCYGSSGNWWEFWNPTSFLYICNNQIDGTINYTGIGQVKAHSSMGFFNNGTVRVCWKYNCRWFPTNDVSIQQ